MDRTLRPSQLTPSLRAFALASTIASAVASATVSVGPAWALPGVAQGQVAIVDSPGHLHAYSGDSGLWTTTPSAGAVSRMLASAFLGYARTAQKIYCFNSTNDRWIEASYLGLPLGESVEGATAVSWTNSEAAGISSVWTLWKKEPIQLGESVLGGGSAETFGLVWTNQRALAYSASSGQWIVQGLGLRPVGAISRRGLGLVWTNQDAFAFSASDRLWIDLELDSPSGVSATGDGQVGLIWSATSAQAYSASAGAWFPIASSDPIRGGSAGGQTAIIWTDFGAQVFDESRANWSAITFPSTSGLAGDGDDDGVLSPPEAKSVVRVVPSPAQGTTLGLRLPRPGAWTVSLYDVAGARVASDTFMIETDAAGAAEILWDWSPDATGTAGTYWLRAESEDGVEARRIVILP